MRNIRLMMNATEMQYVNGKTLRQFVNTTLKDGDSIAIVQHPDDGRRFLLFRVVVVAHQLPVTKCIGEIQIVELVE